jgi:hypothetical protein
MQLTEKELLTLLGPPPEPIRLEQMCIDAGADHGKVRDWLKAEVARRRAEADTAEGRQPLTTRERAPQRPLSEPPRWGEHHRAGRASTSPATYACASGWWQR